ncbi:PREDICTED: uncharacterized protein LOC106329571 isoform X1 [Brassica oleracea var. oleracea]|uniref:uncharacterized protein LOC106329571 isoform X1 n=1 Tax=Brassica oleracea var. oleracea TaxID=109376 RepID=UPI0006A6D6CA|nr:PREDICTED: uncharacterized protein LOC106329571 isoform X1 [Brassica oleracea var. oleracea]XP_013623719.1 PREDICTED: uncharacterized protein LOC106329571 isoform X1 [Brassica oleracea var. oleracea]XP_013623720.1 PREDICTED: uncharacterized protein LOC106329571 isoform X1 [Brassica oleracea var. oleracea]
MCVDPKVIVATSINPKLVGGRLFLNATSHVYFDKKTYAGEVRFYQYVIRLLNVYMCIDTIRLPNHSMVRRLVARGTGLPSAAPLLRSYAKVETMTMAELNAAVVNAASQEIDFLRIGRVVRLDTDKGWCYAACSKCSKKLQRTASAFACGRCNNLHGAGALRRVASLLNNYMLKTVGQDELQASSRLLSFFVDHLNNMFVVLDTNNLILC